ncbi:hypothetical protein TruAng_009130 [Truncatella angustata]|nr:hypothetical protein TruAng_009130 [Truncatella angustata]
MSSKSPQINSLNWSTTEFDGDLVHEAIQRTDWAKLCELASQQNNGLSCVPLDKITNGLHNLVRLLEFSNQTRWVARISLYKSVAESMKLRSEIAVMQFIKDRSDLPVPEIFAYEVDENNAIGVPFILMEFIPGSTAMDAAGGYENHKGQIPLAHRQSFYRSVAECHVRMTDLRFSKIGTIFRTENGEYDIGPFPDIGGPFNTTTDFLKAWAEHASFPRGKDEILQLMKGGPAEQVLGAINQFPSQVKAMASYLSRHGRGPFPLCHADFLHSNMVVNEYFEVIAIIDWEGACTLPWELVSFPAFLNVVPIHFGSPESYKEDGLPADEEERHRCYERQDYVQMVQALEQKDDLLSKCLVNEKYLAFAYSITSYQNGKLGFYNNIFKEEDRVD